MRIRGAASPPQSARCLLEETPRKGISTPSAASPLRADRTDEPDEGRRLLIRVVLAQRGYARRRSEPKCEGLESALEAPGPAKMPSTVDRTDAAGAVPLAALARRVFTTRGIGIGAGSI
jgi:hypothetical protein